MTATSFQILIISLLLLEFLLDTTADILNFHNMSPVIPDEFLGLYDPERYRTSQNYHRDWTRFGLLQRSVTLALVLAFLLGGGFSLADKIARSISSHSLLQALIFAGLLAVLRFVVQVPFSIYGTFGIEAKYGFNKTTPKTFISDLIKGAILGAVIGAPVFALIVYFFEKIGPAGWLYCWILFTILQLFLLYLAPAVIMPLFNRFTPLEAGPLREEIEKYLASRNFRIQGVYTMDGSKRSTKANAFFTGFGNLRRLVLFDTLISKQSPDELIAVLAHEIGHYERKHILKFTALSVVVSGVAFFVFSLFIGNRALTEAFRMENVSVYSSLIFISFLYSPVMRVLGVFTQRLSRQFEFQADAFSAETYSKHEALISALKKLSVDNMSNLTPHPLKVALDYSHPPILTRIEALRKSTRGKLTTE